MKRDEFSNKTTPWNYIFSKKYGQELLILNFGVRKVVIWQRGKMVTKGTMDQNLEVGLARRAIDIQFLEIDFADNFYLL